MLDARWTIDNCTSSCSGPISVDSSIATTFTEIYIPSRTLPLGLYRFTLTITMQIDARFISSASTLVYLTPAGIIANLVQFGTSLITRGHAQDLILDPGRHSVDRDGTILNASVRFSFDRYVRLVHNGRCCRIGNTSTSVASMVRATFLC
jgi:hypothetical protein